jgi:hypothetical protein
MRAAVLLAAAGIFAAGQDPVDEAKVNELVQKLCHPEAPIRDEAQRELLKMGEAVVPALRKAEAPTVQAREMVAWIIDEFELARLRGSLAKNWGKRWFSYSLGGTKSGYMMVECKEKREGKAKEAAFEIAWNGRVKFGAAYRKVDSVSLCRSDRYLSPIRYQAEETDTLGKPKPSTLIEFENGKAKIRKGERQGERDVGEGVITVIAEMVLVCGLPQRVGFKMHYVSLDIVIWHFATGHTLEVVGTEEIEHEGKAVLCYKIRHSGTGCRDYFYWVSEDRRLLRAQFVGGGEIELTTREKAMQE